MHLATTRALIQVAPPGTGGVADYVQGLQGEWAAQGLMSQVLEVSKASVLKRSLAERIDDCAGDLPCSVVLHYSGYGYGHRGLCFWLLDELKALRTRRRHGLRLVVVFHELFAAGEPPWRSAFWLSGLQAVIAGRLARMADALWTNTEQHARWLRQTVGPELPVHVRPVFSNVGEPALVTALSDRPAQAVVFGSPSTRQRVFDRLRGRESALQHLGNDSLIEVGGGGPSKGLPVSIPCSHAGRLETDQLGPLLQGSRFGLLDYPPQFLGKSTVLSAYASHGCAVLNTCPTEQETDGLAAGRDYLVVSTQREAEIGIAAHEARAARLARWYLDHPLTRQALELLALTAAGPGSAPSRPPASTPLRSTPARPASG